MEFNLYLLYHYAFENSTENSYISVVFTHKNNAIPPMYTPFEVLREKHSQ